MNQCPHCAKSFKCLNKHMHRCKVKTVVEETNQESIQEGGIRKTEQCPHCAKSFKWLSRHLPHCKDKAADEDSDESLTESEETDEQDSEETDEQESEETDEQDCEETEERRQQDKPSKEKLKASVKSERCPHCQNLFKRLMMHEPKCKRKGVEEGSDEFRRQAINGELNTRLKKAFVNPRQPDASINGNISNIKDILVNILNNNGFCWFWKALPSGSYSEILKIDRPDEFDVMFTCRLNCDIFYDHETRDGQRLSRLYCALKVKQDEVPSDFISDGGWLCPKAFHKYFREKVDEFVRHRGRQDIKQRFTNVQRHMKIINTPSSPAVTLEYTDVNKIQYSIDLVPAIEFDNFPEPAKDWTCPWIPNEENIKDIRKMFHVVAKVHETEQGKEPGQCRLWRLSFSAAERKLLLSADGKLTMPSHTARKTCRKDVLRLLKQDLADFYENQKTTVHEFPSYNLKMLMVNLYDRQPDNKNWEAVNLVFRYADALRYWKTCIVERNLPHYFIKEQNMLQKDTSQDVQLDALETWVSECVEKYKFPNASLAALYSKEC